MNDLSLPEITYQILLSVQALHLLHHRFVARPISYVEGITGLVLCLNPFWVNLPEAIAGAHILLIIIQVIGSLFIKKLSPRV